MIPKLLMAYAAANIAVLCAPNLINKFDLVNGKYYEVQRETPENQRKLSFGLLNVVHNFNQPTVQLIHVSLLILKSLELI